MLIHMDTEFFLKYTSSPEIYMYGPTLSLHVSLPIYIGRAVMVRPFEIAGEHADQMDDDVAADNGAGDAFWLADVGGDELGLAERAQRLDRKSTRLNSSH